MRDDGQHAVAQERLRQPADKGNGRHANRRTIFAEIVVVLRWTPPAVASEQKPHRALQPRVCGISSAQNWFDGPAGVPGTHSWVINEPCMRRCFTGSSDLYSQPWEPRKMTAGGPSGTFPRRIRSVAAWWPCHSQMR